MLFYLPIYLLLSTGNKTVNEWGLFQNKAKCHTCDYGGSVYTPDLKLKYYLKFDKLSDRILSPVIKKHTRIMNTWIHYNNHLYN